MRLAPGLADPTDLTGPVFGTGDVTAADADLTIGPDGEAVGQRIIVTGRLLDGAGRPIRRSLVEIWQANASGRYRHRGDQWPGALDPNFTGGGRTLTDDDGTYRFTTIKPGAYPWGNHPNAWRPAHIHFSVFGWAFTQRLVTQMYFPDDPLFFQDPILSAVPDGGPPAARGPLRPRRQRAGVGARLPLGHRRARPGGHAVRGRRPVDDAHAGPDRRAVPAPGARRPGAGGTRSPPTTPTRCTLHGTVRDGAGAPVPDAVVETWQWGGPFARCATGPDGDWEVRTRRPAAVATLDGTPQAPHLAISVFARGLLDRVVTRAYFDGRPGERRRSGARASPATRAPTLLARPDGPASLPLRHPPAGPR